MLCYAKKGKLTASLTIPGWSIEEDHSYRVNDLTEHATDRIEVPSVQMQFVLDTEFLTAARPLGWPLTLGVDGDSVTIEAVKEYTCKGTSYTVELNEDRDTQSLKKHDSEAPAMVRGTLKGSRFDHPNSSLEIIAIVYECELRSFPSGWTGKDDDKTWRPPLVTRYGSFNQYGQYGYWDGYVWPETSPILIEIERGMIDGSIVFGFNKNGRPSGPMIYRKIIAATFDTSSSAP